MSTSNICQCKCHIFPRIKTLLILFTCIHIIVVIFLLCTIFSLQRETVGIVLMLLHLLFLLINSFVSVNFQKFKFLVFQIIYFIYFLLTSFSIIFNIHTSLKTKLNFGQDITILLCLVASTYAFLFNCYIIICIFFERKALKKTSNVNDLILCFTCKKYCIEDNPPPSYELFAPPSYSEILPPSYSEISIIM